MTLSPLAITLCIGCQIFLVGGQLLLKKAMGGEKAEGGTRNADEEDGAVAPRPDRRALSFVLGIGALSVWFFLWMGILQQHELSRVFVFEGLNPAFLSIAAWLVLKERIGIRAWLGIVLICGGITLAAMS